MWASGNRPGPYRLYRRDADNAYSVQTNFDGARWLLRGYVNDDYHAQCRVEYADTANSSDYSTRVLNPGDVSITSGFFVGIAPVIDLYNNTSIHSRHGYLEGIFNVDIRPWTDGSWSCGKSGARWSAIWSTNGNIQTSDERLKTDIVESPLGLEFIKKLNPVSYKWKVGGYEYFDESEVTEETETKIKAEIPGKRNHYGLIAQEVKEVLEDLEVDDFAGWVLDDLNDPESRQSLNYGEFIAPLIKAVQELSAEVEALKAAK
jgi:hypothetical protein